MNDLMKRRLALLWGKVLCRLFRHPLDRPMIVRRLANRTRKMYCARCGAHLMTHLDMGQYDK